MDEKENIAPGIAADLLADIILTPTKKSALTTRSWSLGPEALAEIAQNVVEKKAKEVNTRRQTTYVPAAKPILADDEEKAARQAARRKTLANRRVSFAPEATLHVWDLIESRRDDDTSTTRSSEDERYSRAGNTPGAADDASSEDDASEDDQEEGFDFNDETDTAMSIDIEENTMQTVGSASSTSSSALLNAALEQAAHTAGTRGIRYDEFGDDASMELAGDTVTSAFQPWHQQNMQSVEASGRTGQENIDPFGDTISRPNITLAAQYVTTLPNGEDETQDMSMEVTQLNGVILDRHPSPTDTLANDLTMEMTQAVGRIHQQLRSETGDIAGSKKRRMSTLDNGSPSAGPSSSLTKRRRSSTFRTSIGGDTTMDFTAVVGGIQRSTPNPRTTRRQSVGRRQSRQNTADQGEVTMDLTEVAGMSNGAAPADQTVSSVDENEEMTMEFTTVIGRINNVMSETVVKSQPTPENVATTPDARTPRTPRSSSRLRNMSGRNREGSSTPTPGASMLPQSIALISPSRDPKPSSASPRRTRSSIARSESEPAQIPIIRPPSPLTNGSSPERQEVAHPVLPSSFEHATADHVEASSLHLHTPERIDGGHASQRRMGTQLSAGEPLPSVQGQKMDGAARARSETTRSSPSDPTQSLARSLRLLSTPRKETLRHVTPSKITPARQTSPMRPISTRRGPQIKEVVASSRVTGLADQDITLSSLKDVLMEPVQLGDFLETANIRFMDLTASKQRVTPAPTPSRIRKRSDQEQQQDLACAISAAACTIPELEMYRHACNELKHSMNDGKKIIKQIETDAYEITPPLLIAYQQADMALKAELNARMRDVRTDARLESKSSWYKWRSQLLSDLMQHLSRMGEGMLRDDEILQVIEELAEKELNPLLAVHKKLASEAATLEAEAKAMTAEERVRTQEARQRIVDNNARIQEKRDLLRRLQQESDEQGLIAIDLTGKRDDLSRRIVEAERLREATQITSRQQIAQIAEKVENLEKLLGWSIVSARASPLMLTLTYKSQLQLHLHPLAFAPARSAVGAQQNASLSLTYIGNDGSSALERDGSSTKYFVTTLDNALRCVPLEKIRLQDMLRFVRNYWHFAEAVMDAEQRAGLEAPVSSRTTEDGKLFIEAILLLAKVRTKLRVRFEIAVTVDDDLALSTHVGTDVSVIYGEQYDEPGMNRFVQARLAEGTEGWETAVRELNDKLLVQGPAKAARA